MLAITCGLPRSGKTTHAKTYYGSVRVCPDDVRQGLHGEAFIPQAESVVWAITEVMVRALLIGAQDVIVDATNITKAQRAKWVAMAKEFSLRLIIYMIDTPLNACEERNVGEGAVPAHVLTRMAQQFEPPTEDEGTIIVCEM